eukprot:2008762-Amphidinium_carterae.2
MVIEERSSFTQKKDTIALLSTLSRSWHRLFLQGQFEHDRAAGRGRFAQTSKYPREGHAQQTYVGRTAPSKRKSSWSNDMAHGFGALSFCRAALIETLSY